MYIVASVFVQHTNEPSTKITVKIFLKHLIGRLINKLFECLFVLTYVIRNDSDEVLFYTSSGENKQTTWHSNKDILITYRLKCLRDLPSD